MTIHEEINQRYINLWQGEKRPITPPAKFEEYYPFLYDEFPEEKDNLKDYILFVGINPSLTGKKDYTWDNTASRRQDIIKYDVAEEESYFYFNKMHELAEEIGMGFKHMDLFPVRCTSQKELCNTIDIDFDDAKRIFKKTNSFRDECLTIFFETLRNLNPSVIVVANTMASRIFDAMHRNYCFNVKFHDEFGYHTLIYDGKEVPILFSGMLSGQRALDRYSFARLSWHIKFSLKKKSVTY